MNELLECPIWWNGKDIVEAAFCEEFMKEHKLAYDCNAFFTPDGRMTSDIPLRREIYHRLKICAVKNVPHTIKNIEELLKFYDTGVDLTPQQDRIHFANGTLGVNGLFTPDKSEIVRTRLPIQYNPDAPRPETWLRFLKDLLHEDDIPTLQEYLGYCLIPSTKGQRMMVIKGSGGEGKSQIGVVLSAIFGGYMKDGSIAKVSENQFARADLEHQLLMVDDDMKMEALKQTNYVKSIVTAQGKMDLERKNRQSYQGWMFCRLLAFSNGDLQSLYDRSNGFYRRQLILTTKEKSPDRMDDPDIADKMKAEAEGILLWMFEGLQRLIANKFQFTESERTRNNREYVKRDSVNLLDFMEDEGFVRLHADCGASSKEIYETYAMWCEENAMTPMKPRSVSDFLVANEKKYNLEHTNTIINAAGRRVWGFLGIELLVKPFTNSNFR